MPRNCLCFPSKQVDHLAQLVMCHFCGSGFRALWESAWNSLYSGVLIPLILARLCPSSFAHLRKIISRKGAKVTLDDRNDDQSPIDKLVSGRLDKNPTYSICTSNYYSEKEQKHVADSFGIDIFFTALGNRPLTT
jgi:hypothetical protein